MLEVLARGLDGAEKRPAAQVIREFMRHFIDTHKDNGQGAPEGAPGSLKTSPSLPQGTLYIVQGQLFSTFFLDEGICETPHWKDLEEADLDAFLSRLQSIYASVDAESQLDEATTETELIVKVLAALGWSELLPQHSASGSRREDIPDILLLADAAAKREALSDRREGGRFVHGLAIVECKRWLRPLDRGDSTDRLDPGTPSNQILRYLSAAETASERRIQWGFLTNGAQWRLYYQGARTRSEEFLEIDLPPLLGTRGFQADLPFGGTPRHVLKAFYCLFHRSAFLPQAWDPEGRTYHQYALQDSRRFEERVSQDLGQRVFTVVFPDLANALATADTSAPATHEAEYLDQVRESALVLLYRLLFVLYAEDRALLPVNDRRYSAYSLRRIREYIRDSRDSGTSLSATSTRLWDELQGLFQAIAHGDRALGLPAYDGGLFEAERVPLLRRIRVPDAQLAPVIDELSRRADENLPVWINYRDLPVQHLGGIYERLLQYRLESRHGRLFATLTSTARRSTGSYYTHDDLVKLLIGEALAPLVDERVVAFETLVTTLRGREELSEQEWQGLNEADPATRILDLRVCDPAMGSGHFLVALVDYIADTVLENISHAVQIVQAQRWGRPDWLPPIALQIAELRERILRSKQQQGWSIDRAQLDDRRVVRRMILERVVHGTDKDPMAVELAKVALWLHTFTAGAPLSFLDHHLRCGDALFGGWTHQLTDELGKLAGERLHQEDVGLLRQARAELQSISELTDIDIAEAHRSKTLMDSIERTLLPQKLALDFIHSKRWAPKEEAADYDATWADLLSGEFGDNILDAIQLLSKPRLGLHGDRQRRAHSVVQRALARAKEIRFLHWDIAFPLIWPDAQDASARQGFDAIVGNPPWDRMKLQEVEWFAHRRPEIAKAVRASDRKALIARLEHDQDPLWSEYLFARDLAEAAARVARTCGDYPLLSGGDVNLYSLFVERAAALIQPKGMVGLLTPSGISADKSAAEFFGGLVGASRLSALLDFENRKVFFPDIDGRFKFSALVFSGPLRAFRTTRCAFFLHNLAELSDPDRLLRLSPEDFAAVNPNTGGSPVFRSSRDAKITIGVYHRLPVLVDRRGRSLERAWPVQYLTMFHMTNDSKLFKSRAELERLGWYPVPINRYKKGPEEVIALYEGKMIQMYDHRAASVVVHADNVHRAAQQEATDLAQHRRFDFFPTPQFWVDPAAVAERYCGAWAIGFKEITAPTNQRTMIACVVPGVGFSNKFPLLVPMPGSEALYGQLAPLLVANLNAFAFDFIVRQKLQGQTLNLFIVEQLPVVSPRSFERTMGSRTLGEIVRQEVLRLSYTAHDLRPFARDLGYSGEPFPWDEEDRRHRMARLDALFFRLYGLDREDAAYIMDSFPIVREADVRAHGRYLTKDLILGYMNAVDATPTRPCHGYDRLTGRKTHGPGALGPATLNLEPLKGSP